MIKLMFLCTGNSCRSQMAEGFARQIGKSLLEPYSAGLAPSRVNPYAINVMRELGINISQQTSKAIDPQLLQHMDVIITLCGHAEAMCPMTPPGIKRIHWPIDDPMRASGTEEKILNEFRKARDEIKKRINEFIATMQKERNAP